MANEWLQSVGNSSFRCWWPGDDVPYQQYHDTEWGRPVHDDRKLFEKLCLEGFQAGLSWLTILKKREAFREAFAGFDPLVVARFTTRDVQRLMRNAGIQFVCRDVKLTVANSQSAFTSRYKADEEILIPVAHHDGNYFADAATLDRLEGEGRVAFRYAEEVNGSARNIAGVLNEGGNVLGMMPHPERMSEAAHGGLDGKKLFEALASA